MCKRVRAEACGEQTPRGPAVTALLAFLCLPVLYGQAFILAHKRQMIRNGACMYIGVYRDM